jgi:hypothetical protein
MRFPALLHAGCQPLFFKVYDVSTLSTELVRDQRYGSIKFSQNLRGTNPHRAATMPVGVNAERNVHASRTKQTNDAICGGHDVCLFGRIGDRLCRSATQPIQAKEAAQMAQATAILSDPTIEDMLK